MESITTPEQLKEIKDSLKSQKPVPIAMEMRKEGLEFIVAAKMLFDRAKYIQEQGIRIVGSKTTLGKYECRILYSDHTAKVISIREHV